MSSEYEKVEPQAAPVGRVVAAVLILRLPFGVTVLRRAPTEFVWPVVAVVLGSLLTHPGPVLGGLFEVFRDRQEDAHRWERDQGRRIEPH